MHQNDPVTRFEIPAADRAGAARGREAALPPPRPETRFGLPVADRADMRPVPHGAHR